MISVCIPTYNGEKYIFQQMDSILSQLEENDEIIISDDESSDRTLEIILSINDKRIKIFKNKNKKSLITNVENALSHASGDIIFLSDQDDVWLPDKVNIFIRNLKDVDLVISDCYVTDSNLNILHNSFFSQNRSEFNKWKALVRNPYLGCCMAFKKEIFPDILPFPDSIPMHDIWIGNVGAFQHTVKFIPDKLIYYRRHSGNSSTASEPTKANTIKQIQYRTGLIVPLILNIIKSNIKR
jgi:glycosyltransferase involved in cell wall biosynthesis